jgi:membrane protein implicated in regulation of membrane protease activity
MRPVTIAQWVGFIAIAAALVISRRGLPDVYPGDVVGLIVLGLMLIWLLRPSRRISDDAGGHERPDQGLAFRLGKLLNRVRSGRNRRSVPASTDKS